MDSNNLSAPSNDPVYVPSSPKKRGRDDDEDEGTDTSKVKRSCLPAKGRLNTAPLQLTPAERNEVLEEVRTIMARNNANYQLSRYTQARPSQTPSGASTMDARPSAPDTSSNSTAIKLNCHSCNIASKEAMEAIVREVGLGAEISRLRREVKEQKKEVKRCTEGAINEQNLFKQADKVYNEWRAFSSKQGEIIAGKDAEIASLKKQLECGGDKSKWQILHDQEKAVMDDKVGQANSILQEVLSLRQKAEYYEKGAASRDLNAARQQINWLTQGGLTKDYNNLKTSYDTLLATAQNYETKMESKPAAAVGSEQLYTQNDMDAKNLELSVSTAAKDEEIKRLTGELATINGHVAIMKVEIIKAAGDLASEQGKVTKLTKDLGAIAAEATLTRASLQDASDKNEQLVKASVIEKLETGLIFTRQKQQSSKLLAQQFARLWFNKTITKSNIKKLNTKITVHEQTISDLNGHNIRAVTNTSALRTQNSELLAKNSKLESQVLRDDKLEEIRELKKNLEIAKTEGIRSEARMHRVEEMNKRFFSYLSCPVGYTAPLKKWKYKAFVESKIGCDRQNVGRISPPKPKAKRAFVYTPKHIYRSPFDPAFDPAFGLDPVAGPEDMQPDETWDEWVVRLDEIALQKLADIQAVLDSGPDFEEELRARLRAPAPAKPLVENEVDKVPSEEEWAEYNDLQHFADVKSQQAAETGDLRSVAAQRKSQLEQEQKPAVKKQRSYKDAHPSFWESFIPGNPADDDETFIPGAFGDEDEELEDPFEVSNSQDAAEETSSGGKWGLFSMSFAFLGGIFKR